MIKSIVATYKEKFSDRGYLTTMFLSIVFLCVSLFINFYAGIYATESASNPVTDIILSNIPVFDFDKIFLYGPFVFWVVVILLQIHHPERYPFWLKSIALFIIIRSIFISLTHIGPFPGATPVDLSGVMGNFTFGGDLFFSAHTGLPFLTTLIFWNHKFMRYLSFACAIFFGAIVLLAHLHYSIDVLAAFFITYAIYKMAEFLFKQDFRMFSWNKNA